jgi:hypothetical protein
MRRRTIQVVTSVVLWLGFVAHSRASADALIPSTQPAKLSDEDAGVAHSLKQSIEFNLPG